MYWDRPYLIPIHTLSKEGVVNLQNNFLLEIRGISKSFPGVRALDKVHLEVKKGEVMALVGENGAGKSTLMKVLSGVYMPEEGEVLINGQRVKIENPRHAEELGISIVYQELSVFPAMSVSENIFVNRLPKNRSGQINYRTLYKNVQEILDNFKLTDIKSKTAMRDLSIGRQQVVEILRATSRDSKVLILDEPTSALTERETDLLFEIINMLKAKGVSIIYISHRLEEIFHICDRVTVLRDGKYVTTLNIKETCKDEIVKHMVGRDVAYNYGANTSEIGGTILKIKNLSYKNIVKDVSFSLRSGEVLGIGGLEGSGRTELVECIFGARKIDAGKIFIKGKEVKIKSPIIAKKNGMAYITKDRKRVGLFMRLSVEKNITSGNLDKFSEKFVINHKKARENAEHYVKKFDIKTPTLKKLVLALSGGNQQKVLLALWFTRNPEILIVDEPTRGIDVGTKEEIHKLIRSLAKKGVGVVMISSDMPELLCASDRIIVMYEGTITGELKYGEATEEKVVRLASNESAN